MPHSLKIIMPFYGEFGFMILRHLRYVHLTSRIEPNQIVCCEREHISLFPSATHFYHDFVNPYTDEERAQLNSWSQDLTLETKLRHTFREAEIVHAQYGCYWHMSDHVKPKLKVPQQLPSVDITIAPRKRKFYSYRNWDHWQTTVKALTEAGYTIGIIGTEHYSTAEAGDAIPKAWQHSQGATEGSIDLLSNCKLYIGTDSGPTHLAALMDVPTLAFRAKCPDSSDLLVAADRANKNYFKRLDDVWDDPETVIGTAIDILQSKEMQTRYYRFWSQFGEDRFVKSLLPQNLKGTFCEVGAADGVNGSNTAHFELDGWGGVLIEPDPRQTALESNRPNSKIFRCACGKFDTIAPFHLENDPALSGLNRTSKATVAVKVRTLTSILDEAKVTKLDLLSVDTEGTELDVWAGLEPRLYPTVLIIEWNTVGQKDRQQEIEDVILKCDYQLMRKTDGNLIFMRMYD